MCFHGLCGSNKLLYKRCAIVEKKQYKIKQCKTKWTSLQNNAVPNDYKCEQIRIIKRFLFLLTFCFGFVW